MTDLLVLVGAPAAGFVAMVVALVRRSRRGSARDGGEAARYPGSRDIQYHKRLTNGDKARGMRFPR